MPECVRMHIYIPNRNCVLLYLHMDIWPYFYLGVASLIPAQSHTFVKIDHEIISTVILLLTAESFKKGCCLSYKRKYVQEVLVNCLFKLAPGKSVVTWTDRPVPPWPYLLTWDIKQKNKQTIPNHVLPLIEGEGLRGTLFLLQMLLVWCFNAFV